MTEAEVDGILEKLSIKDGSLLRRMFYQKNGLPKQGLLSKERILERCSINCEQMNTFEKDGVLRNLGSRLAYLRRQARDAGLAWLDCELHRSDGPRISQHGFAYDVDKIVANAEKYERRADNAKAIAKETRKIADRVVLTAN